MIAKHFAPLAVDPGAFGLGDDAAVIPSIPGFDWVVSTDSLVAGVHFFPDDPPDLIARKLLRVNLSDLAAKGAVARYYTLNCAFAPGCGESWIARFAHGLRKDQEEYGISLMGGDTVAASGPLVLCATMFGSVCHGGILKRSGARAGDGIYVSGTIGDGCLGLKLRSYEKDHAYLVQRYLLPQPRTKAGLELCGVATAAMDVSDGLVGDLEKLCAASHAGAQVQAAAVPLSPEARAVLSRKGAALADLLTGGDDYEILCTIPHGVNAPENFTRIGSIHSAPGVFVTDASGEVMTFAASSYTHFAP